jgi:hypothetical protein
MIFPLLPSRPPQPGIWISVLSASCEPQHKNTTTRNPSFDPQSFQPCSVIPTPPMQQLRNKRFSAAAAFSGLSIQLFDTVHRLCKRGTKWISTSQTQSGIFPFLCPLSFPLSVNGQTNSRPPLASAAQISTPRHHPQNQKPQTPPSNPHYIHDWRRCMARSPSLSPPTRLLVVAHLHRKPPKTIRMKNQTEKSRMRM